MKKFFALLLIVFTHVLVFAQTTESPLLSVMQSELDRNFKTLKLEDFEKPFFISYHIVDRNDVTVMGSLGALLDENENEKRFVHVDLRVGDYAFNSTKPVDEIFDYDKDEGEDNQELQNIPLPLGNDAEGLKKYLWRATDNRYKRALSTFLKRKGKLTSEVQEKDKADDFSKENPQNYIGDTVTLKTDKAAWEEKVRVLSAIFKKHPEILNSSVSIAANARNDYFVNTEGTKLQEGKISYWVRISASTKADDGMWVESFRSFFAWDESKLPPQKELADAVENVMDEVLALKNAPVMEAFVGPAIIQSPASGVFFHEVLGHRLEAHRIESKTESETFKDKVGKQIMAPFLTVMDDPSLKEYRGIPMDAYYAFDDQGVKSAKTVLVDKGVLKTFLLSRKPVKGFPNSNGHGRAQLQYIGWGNDYPVARMGNLIVEAHTSYPLPKLKEMLMKECQKKNKPYGLLFVLSEGGNTETNRYQMDVFQSKPLLVYKVDAKTGKETLVRGVKFGGTPLVGLDKILAAGDDPKVFNGFCGAESGYVPQANAAPSVLLSEIEVAKTPTTKSKPPILPPPFGQ